MTKRYFQRTRWATFTYAGTTYTFDHLDERQLTVRRPNGDEHIMVVTFADHCFTRDAQPGDDPALHFPGCSRTPAGCFDIDRYELSRAINQHIDYVIHGQVYLMKGNNFAIVHAVDLAGNPVEYGIFFALDPVKGIEGIDLHMRVRSAYPYTEQRPTTYGKVRFSALVDLRLKNRYPTLNTSQRRRW
jgi:hypothetical protein